jgi:hypothetical protein
MKNEERIRLNFMHNYLIVSQSGDFGLNKQLALKVMNVLKMEHGKDSIYVNASGFTKADYAFDKIIFIIPEWNGTYPYLFKQIIDNSEWPSLLDKKKILLIGTSNGKFGNVMGVNHFEYPLNYVGSSVFTKKIYIPKLDENIENEEYIGYLKDVLLEFHLA